MPQGEKSKGKSWSLRNMLGRKRARNGSSGKSSKDPAVECASVKERVLAKLQEPPSNEKEAARHSVDELRAPMFSPRLSYDGHEHFSQLKDAFAAAGQGHRDAQPTSRHSTCSWQLEREAVQSRSSSSAFQASPSASTASIVNSRSTQHGISSPVSNVIARLMGLEELDAHDSTSHIESKRSLGRAEAASSSESSSRGRQGQQGTRQGHTATEDVHRNEAWKQEKSPCPLQQSKQQPRARGKPVEEVTRSPRQARHVFLSHGCITGSNQEDEKRSPQAHHTREHRNPAQDFLDEMEEELKQCDKALERIEAVMQLKRRLLYLSRSAGAELRASCQDVTEHSLLDYTRADRSIQPMAAYGSSRLVQGSHVSRCNGRFHRDSNGQHVRAHSSLDHRQGALWEEEQSWDQMRQLPEDEHYSSTRGGRSRNAGMGGHPQMNMTNIDTEPQSPRPQMHRRFLHRRSVSDGETPVFSLTGATYNFEAARACITKVMGPGSPIFNNSRQCQVAVSTKTQFCKDSDVPRTPPSRAQHSGDEQKMTDLFQVEEACMLSRSSRPQIQHKPVSEAMCEQPSPVSVLENASQDDSPRSSEDYEDFKPAKNGHGSIDEVGSSACGDEIQRKSVVRALWRTSAVNDDVVEKKPEEEVKGRSSNLVFRPAVRDHAIKDEDLVKEMHKSWCGFSSEIAEVAVAVECMILKKLVEETIILYMMMP